MACVDDESIDPLGVAQLCSSQQDLVGLNRLHFVCLVQLEVACELVETFVRSFTHHMALCII